MVRLLFLLSVLLSVPQIYGNPLGEKLGCFALTRLLSSDRYALSESISYSKNLSLFFEKIQAQVDPKRELSTLQSKNPETKYGEFFGPSEVEFVLNRLRGWGFLEKKDSLREDILADYLILRAHGLKPGKENELASDLARQGISFSKGGKDVTIEALDLAIAEAGAIENSKRIRVFPRSLIEKADTRVMPQVTVVFHGNLSGKEIPFDLAKQEKARSQVEKIRDSGRGVLLLGDIHLYRGDAENKAFELILKELKRKPPKKIVLGGDIVDAPGVEKKALPKLAKELATQGKLPTGIEIELFKLAKQLADKKELPEILREPEVRLKPGVNPPEFTAESAAKIRFALTVLELKKIKEALPETEISFIVGNHDVPRLEFLKRVGEQETLTYRDKSGREKTLKLPYFFILNRGKLEKSVLISALAETNPTISKEVLEAEASQWFPQMKTAFQIKGSSIDTVKEHGHYDLAFAEWFKQRGRDFGIETVITDPTAVFQIGDTALVHEPVLLTRDIAQTPNLLRVIEPSDNAYGAQPSLNEFVRRFVNFDQHVSAMIQREEGNGNTFSNILVGTLAASNSNPGQRYSAAVIDPASGEVFPVTFFQSDKYFSDTDSLGISPFSLASITRLNYELPSSKRTAAK